MNPKYQTYVGLIRTPLTDESKRSSIEIEAEGTVAVVLNRMSEDNDKIITVTLESSEPFVSRLHHRGGTTDWEPARDTAEADVGSR